MTALLFEAAGQRYALDIAEIVEIVPAVHVRPLAGVPAYVAGICRYRGSMVPVVDLSALLGQHCVADRLSTRLILVRYPGPAGVGRVLGLLAEHATDCISGEAGPIVTAGVDTPETPYLGGLTTDDDRTVQFVKVEHLLNDTLRDRLFVEGA